MKDPLDRLRAMHRALLAHTAELDRQLLKAYARLRETERLLNHRTSERDQWRFACSSALQVAIRAQRRYAPKAKIQMDRDPSKQVVVDEDLLHQIDQLQKTLDDLRQGR